MSYQLPGIQSLLETVWSQDQGDLSGSGGGGLGLAQGVTGNREGPSVGDLVLTAL